MPRILRIDVGGRIYHVLDRARAQMFGTERDHRPFEMVLGEEEWEGPEKVADPISRRYGPLKKKGQVSC